MEISKFLTQITDMMKNSLNNKVEDVLELNKVCSLGSTHAYITRYLIVGHANQGFQTLVRCHSQIHFQRSQIPAKSAFLLHSQSLRL